MGFTKLVLENLPPSLHDHTDAIRRCLEAFDRVVPLQTVYLFGSHARVDARPDSDVDLCVVSEGAKRQLGDWPAVLLSVFRRPLCHPATCSALGHRCLPLQMRARNSCLEPGA